jgi:hypothetical protein
VVKRKNKGFYEEYRKEGQGKDRLFDKKSSILKFEIVAIFCHYAEILGAFLHPCHKPNADRFNLVDEWFDISS